jgi:Condensation domain
LVYAGLRRFALHSEPVPMPDTDPVRVANSLQTLSSVKRGVLDRIVRGDLSNWLNSPTVISRLPSKELAAPPLSIAQEHFVFDENSSLGVPLYNETVSLRLKGPLLVDVLEQCLGGLIRRHEVLRTTYSRKDGRLFQAIHPVPETFLFTIVDLSDFPSVEQDAARQRYADEQARHRFDLERGPLFRASLLRLGLEEHILFIAAHLSIIDGASVYQILPVELASRYQAIVAGKQPPFDELPFQFADFAYWQNQWLGTDQRQEQQSFWNAKLAGEIPVLNWPRHGVLPKPKTFRGVIRPFAFSPELTAAIKDLNRREGVTLFVALLGGFVALLHLYAGQEDIVVGTLSPSGRKLPEVQQLLGHFINPVALRFDLTAVETFRELLRHVRDTFLEAMTNDMIPIEILEKEIADSDNSSRRSFFSVGLSLQPPMPQLPYDWTVTSMDAQSGGARWDLYTAFVDRPSGILGRVQYNPDVFEDSTIAQMWTDLGDLLVAASSNPDKRLSNLLMSTTRES